MSSSTVDETKDILDIYRIKKTPEIYPMTSMHETMEYFHEKLNQLNKRVYENSATIQRLGEQLQQLSTRPSKPAVSSERAQQTAPQPASPVKAEKADVVSMLLRRFSQQPAAQAVAAAPEPVAGVDEFAPPEPVIQPGEPDLEAELEPEIESDIEPERPDVASIHFRRFSDQELQSVQMNFCRSSEPPLESVQEPHSELDPDPDAELDLSPCLWSRVEAKFKFEQELESEPAQEPDVEPPTPQRAQASARGLKRLSLCMMPPDAMQDVLDVISPAPAPSPAIPLFLE